MSNQNTTSIHIVGNGNIVNVHQQMTVESGRALGLVLKFLATVLLLPVTLPLLLTFHGYRVLTGEVDRG